MTTFMFDESKDFEANLTDFLNYMCTDNAEMGAILSAHISKLKGASDDALRLLTKSQCQQPFSFIRTEKMSPPSL